MEESNEEEKKLAALEYKKNKQAELDSLKVGQKDISNNLITHIFTRGDDFVVYEIQTPRLVDSIRVYADSLIEGEKSESELNYEAMRIKFVEVKSHLYKAVDKGAMKSLVAAILTHGIRKSVAEADSEIDKLIVRIKAEYAAQYQNRFKLLIVPSSLFLLVLMLSAISFCWFPGTICDGLKEPVLAISGGIVGGFFALLLSARKLRCDEEVRPHIYIIYGLIRISISIVGAIIVFYAIKANVLAGFCNDLKDPVTGYFVFCVLAGFSETLVPDFLGKLESNAND